ncbi:hypothetical protein XpiCFBP4643_22065 [Xanthomonas pisi]|uniref:Uncharacterized protein n=1 Tax=Xanthomonas pisi TaxID=56457 RepID=A0A2S7CSF7_9XANT|nr:hypothetical protein XpiCFBP4643_22065 [Xanthomonas pisi]
MVFNNAASKLSGAVRAPRTRPTRRLIQASESPSTVYCSASFFSNVTSQLSGAVPASLAGPLVAWMPPSSPH